MSCSGGVNNSGDIATSNGESKCTGLSTCFGEGPKSTTCDCNSPSPPSCNDPVEKVANTCSPSVPDTSSSCGGTDSNFDQSFRNVPSNDEGPPNDSQCRSFIQFARGANSSNCPALAGATASPQLYNPANREKVQQNVKELCAPIEPEPRPEPPKEEPQQPDPDFRNSSKSGELLLDDEEEWCCPPMPNNVPALVKPGWMECPPKITDAPCPTPEGVKIKPISKGVRTNFARNPRCGTCGAKRKPIKKMLKHVNNKCPAVRDRTSYCTAVAPLTTNNDTIYGTVMSVVTQVGGLVSKAYNKGFK